MTRAYVAYREEVVAAERTWRAYVTLCMKAGAARGPDRKRLDKEAGAMRELRTLHQSRLRSLRRTMDREIVEGALGVPDVKGTTNASE